MEGKARQDKIGSAERLQALLNGQRVDRVPFSPWVLGFAAINVGYSLASFYSDPERSFWAQIWTQEQYGYDAHPQYWFACTEAWDFGAEIKFPSDEYEQAPTATRFLVQSEEDIDKLELPDVETAGSIPNMMAFSKLQEKYGLPITWAFGDPFTISITVCDPTTVCRWIVKKPELVHRLARLITNHVLNVARYWVDTFGPERFLPYSINGASGNLMLSPKQFAEFDFPYLKEIHEKVLAMGVKHIFCHICGEQNLNLPYLAQVPMGHPGMVSFGHQVDLTTAIKYFGDNCIIMGNVEPQVIQNGTPQEVYELCRQAIEKGKRAPQGYVLMPGCELPPMAPPYNAYVMQKAVRDFGWYE